jgi:hypothetical protein
VREAGKLFRVSERTVRNWEAARVLVPYAAFKLMRILRCYELPGAAWKGYRLVGDTLWSPEGLAFRPEEQRWWWLTVQMARQFRTMMAAQREPVPVREPAASPPGPVAYVAEVVLRSAQARGECDSGPDLAPPFSESEPYPPSGGGSLPEKQPSGGEAVRVDPRLVTRGSPRNDLNASRRVVAL